VRAERKQEKVCDKQMQLSRSGVPAARGSSLSSKRSSTSSMHFPSLMKRERRESESQLPSGINKARGGKDADIVCIKDLSWTDKELVLRALFAKLNESAAHRENAEAGRRRASDDTEPLFFVSEGAIDFSPNGTYGNRCDSLGSTTSTV
jgi:hypothetical protein